MTDQRPTIYIMANERNGTPYTGVTSDLKQRVYQHKQGSIPGFTKQHYCKQLVYYESYGDMASAIEREKQIKTGSRKNKLTLIESLDPKWLDLYETLL
jgi:predicted GIY-YIG superfamily endonuclease